MAAAQTETLHSRLLEEITRKIVDGQWPPGHLLPKETEMAAQYGVSRMTMNKVLTQLAQEGYVVRRKRTGTMVAQPRAQSAVLAINNIQDEVAALGRRYRWDLLASDRRRPNGPDQRLLDLDPAEAEAEALVLHGLHYSNDDPFCLESRAINLTTVPDAATMDFAAEVPGSWLLQTMPWTNARHHVRAINVSGRDAAQLHLPLGAACLEILRKTQIEGAWVTSVRLLYPGEAHQLVAEFEGRMGG